MGEIRGRFQRRNSNLVLPFPEVAYYKAEASTTQLNPVVVNDGCHSRIRRGINVGNKNLAPKLYEYWMDTIVGYSKENFSSTRANMAKDFDKWDLSEPEFNVGYLLMLDTCNIKTKGRTY